jgi:hypothetical protein
MSDDKVIVPKKAPWGQTPGVEQKLDIDESENLAIFDDFNEDDVEFNKDNKSLDMDFDYAAARKNAHFCVHAARKILNMIAGNLLYSRDPLIADSCVKLVKVISENNRDLIKLHKDFKTTQQIGKPKPVAGDNEDEKPDTPEEKSQKIKATVSEVVAAQKEMENDGKD